LVFALITTWTFAQYVEISDMPMSMGTNTGFTVSIDDMDEKTVQKEWESFMKEYSGKSKRDRKTNEVLTSKTAIGGVGGNVNVYSSSTEVGSRVKHTVWFESDGMFMNEGQTAQTDVAEGIMERFIVHMKRVGIQNELDAEEDTMKDLQKELDKEEKNEDRQHDNIEKYEKQIQEAKAEIVESKQIQEQKTQEIEAQQNIIEAVQMRLSNVSLEDDDDVEEMMKRKKKKME